MKHWVVIGDCISSNSTLKDSGLNDSKDFQSFCQEHCEKSAFFVHFGRLWG